MLNTGLSVFINDISFLYINKAELLPEEVVIFKDYVMKGKICDSPG